MPQERIINYIRSCYPDKGFIPLHEPRFGGKEKEYLIDTIDSTFVSSVGPYVDLFERQMAEVSQTAKAVAVVNGTAGLQVALRIAGVSSGDLVLTQAVTFVATPNAITYLGAEPVFLDVDLDTMGLSAVAVAQYLDAFAVLREEGCYHKITKRKISACVPMHTFGFPVHLDALIAVCAAWHIPIIEDAAESLGSLYKGMPTGSYGMMGVFSFNGNKIITAGGGGAIVTSVTDCAVKAKYLTTTAKVPHAYDYYHDEMGYNYRMPNLNAALMCAQLEQLSSFVASKRALAEDYAAFFKQQGICFRTEQPGTTANYWLMCLQMADKKERDELLKMTNDAGVMTRPIWQLMFRLPMYQHCYRDGQQNAVFLEERIVNIPSSVR